MTDNVVPFKKKQLAHAAMLAATAPAAAEEDLSIEALLQEKNITWESLEELRQSLNMDVYKFISEFENIANHPLVKEGLGDSKAEFDKLASLFMRDVTDFSAGVANIRKSHETKAGRILNDEAYSEFMAISMAYQEAYMNVATVVGPLVMQMVIVLSEAQASNQQKLHVVVPAGQDPSLTDPTVVSDVEVKPVVEESVQNV